MFNLIVVIFIQKIILSLKRMDMKSNVEIINLNTSVLLWMLIILCIIKRTNKIEQNFYFIMVMVY